MLVASVSGEWLLEMYVEEMCTLVDISGSSSSKSSISEAVLKCKEPVLLTPLELKLSIESELVALPIQNIHFCYFKLFLTVFKIT